MNPELIAHECRESYGKNIRVKHLLSAVRDEGVFEKVVELGCKEGYLLHNVSAREKIGYDLKPRRVFKDVKYFEKDIQGLGLDSADLVICSEVIEHIEDDQALAGVMNNQLRDGGLLFLTTINSNIRVDKSEQDKKYGHIRRYGSELKTVLENGGFDTIDFYPIRSSHYYKYKGDLPNYSCDKDRIEGVSEASGWVYVGRCRK